MANESEKSLGDQNTFQGQAKPASQEVDTRSLGDQATFAGEIIGDVVDDSVEVVDIAARYEIEKTLGKGGMGEVLLATDKRLDRQVAIKRIRGDSSRSKTAVNRFLTEAKAIASLSHPNIVHINDYGRDKEGPFLIMEYVDGGSLLDRCRDGALPIDQAIELTSQLCDGLAKAHDRGIIHRDIKPANILLTQDGVPKLSDFGLAKAESTDTGMTVAGAVLGTLDFMPPEQRRDAALADVRSDLWSLAATFYQMVTGESPRVIDLDLCPPELRAFLAQGLKSKKEDRYQSAREFRDALKRSLDTTQASNPEQLITGECPQCHAKNDVSRKFCRGCAQPLEVACLGCNAKMPIWENICGECGTKQLELLQPRREALQANRDAAIASLESLDFEKARSLATKVQDETDPRLQHLRAWCNGFLIEIDNRRAQELQHVQQLLAEANSHEQAHDYAAGIRTLEQVPESLRGTLIDGIGITVASMLKHLESIEKKRHQLETQIRLLVAKREMNGLPELVAEMLEITPDRKDLLRLKSQLEERTAKLIAIRDEAFAEAQSKRQSQDYEGALSELDKIDPSVIEPTMVAARSEIQRTIREIDELLRSIDNDVNAKRYAGLLERVNRMLELKSDHEEMQQLRAQMLERESQNVEKVKQLVLSAEDYRRSIHFEDALKLLLTIPMEYRTDATNALTDSCSQLETERKRAFEKLRRGIKDGSHEEGLSGIRSYQSLLKRSSLQDKELDRLIPEFQKEIERSEANRAIAKQVLIVVLAIGVPSVFIGSIVAINIQNRRVEEQAQLAVMQAEKDAKEAEMVRLATEKAEQERIAAEKAAKTQKYEQGLADTEYSLVRMAIEEIEQKVQRFQNAAIQETNDADLDGLLVELRGLSSKYPKAASQASKLLDLSIQRASSVRDSIRKQRREMEQRQVSLLGVRKSTSSQELENQLKKYVEALPIDPISKEFKDALNEAKGWRKMDEWNTWCSDFAIAYSKGLKPQELLEQTKKMDSIRSSINGLPNMQAGDRLREYADFAQKRGEILDSLKEDFNESVIMELITLQTAVGKPTRNFMNHESFLEYAEMVGKLTPNSKSTLPVVSDVNGAVTNKDFKGKIDVVDEPRTSLRLLVRNLQNNRDSILADWDNQMINLLRDTTDNKKLDGKVKEMIFARLLSAAREGSTSIDGSVGRVQDVLFATSAQRGRWFIESEINFEMNGELKTAFDQSLKDFRARKEKENADFAALSKSKMVWVGELLRDSTGAVSASLYREDVPDGQLYTIVGVPGKNDNWRLVTVGDVSNREGTLESAVENLLPGRPLYWMRAPANPSAASRNGK